MMGEAEIDHLCGPEDVCDVWQSPSSLDDRLLRFYVQVVRDMVVRACKALHMRHQQSDKQPTASPAVSCCVGSGLTRSWALPPFQTY